MLKKAFDFTLMTISIPVASVLWVVFKGYRLKQRVFRSSDVLTIEE